MTLMPKVADRYREYRDAFHDIANEVGAFTLHTGGTDMFGQKRNKPVRLIRPHPSLQQLHEDLLSTISDEIPLDLTRFGPNYHPHISDATFMQRNGKIDTVGFPAGQTLRFGAFAVLATQHDGLWHVVDKLHLKG
jgi:2'-5' RNA ligase